MSKPAGPATPSANVFVLLKKYPKHSLLLVAFAFLANGLGLIIPKLIAIGIDSFTSSGVFPSHLILPTFLIITGIFIFSFAQNLMQTIASERVALDLRKQLTQKISLQNNATIEKFTPAVLLTNLTSDIDAVKTFIAQAVAGIVSSLLLIIGSSILLLITDWKLALVVLLIIPIIGITFKVIFGKVQVLFIKGQEVIDWLNKVINESILGSATVRILNSEDREKEKFKQANETATNTGLKILSYFSSLIPVITFVSGMAVLVIVVLGGYFVIKGEMTLGSFTAFNSYVGILIFPIIMMGFMSNVIARSAASYGRIQQIFDHPNPTESGKLSAENLSGAIEAKDLSLVIGTKNILNKTTFKIKAGTRTAIIGPTAAGKTQLLSLIVGLTEPTSGQILFDGKKIKDYDQNSFFNKVGLVFQESVLFNTTIEENIGFSDSANSENINKAIATAELENLISTLPDGLKTIVSERGTSLSGGQKQRLMLARALALNPQVLLLDDFTARVDLNTEKNILNNIKKNYPNITLISITQKISSVIDYDQILVLMEGDVIAKGTHEQLLKSSPEYIQMYESQKSTNQYELSTD
ncbi:ABC transporter ATP-binding protein/permease [Patescibacteria group bacterium]|nr:ABC transporter ATP-binding protein/permease [Patescibacteria group bacterium]